MDMPFGKHAGSPLSELPDGYLAWLHLKADIAGRPELMAAVSEEWHKRECPPLTFDSEDGDRAGQPEPGKTCKFYDLGLGAWVAQHMASKLSDCGRNHAKAEQMKDLWKSRTEADWVAWRQLLPLRAEANARFDPSTISIAVARRVALLQPPYQAYSFGLEVAALRELLR